MNQLLNQAESTKEQDAIVVKDSARHGYALKCDRILENRPSCHKWDFEKYRF